MYQILKKVLNKDIDIHKIPDLMLPLLLEIRLLRQNYYIVMDIDQIV